MSGSFRHVWRATFTLHKKKGISDEEFKDHYTKIHAPMFVNNVGIKHGVLDYNLHFCTEAERAELRAILGDDVKIIDADVIVTVTFPSRECLIAVFSDPSYGSPYYSQMKICSKRGTVSSQSETNGLSCTAEPGARHMTYNATYMHNARLLQ